MVTNSLPLARFNVLDPPGLAPAPRACASSSTGAPRHQDRDARRRTGDGMWAATATGSTSRTCTATSGA